MPVNAGDAISAQHWNTLRTGITERGGTPPASLSTGGGTSSLFVRDIRSTLGGLVSDFADEETGNSWTLPSILTHLSIGEGDPKTWTDANIGDGDPVRAVHFNEVEAVLKELRWEWATDGVNSTEWRKEALDQLTAAGAYTASKADTPFTYSTMVTGHIVEEYQKGWPPVTYYSACRQRYCPAYDTSSIPDAAVIGAAKLGLVDIPAPDSGRSFNIKVYSVSSSGWSTGTYRGQVGTNGSGVVTLGTSDINKTGTSYFLLTSDREEADDRPATDDVEFVPFNSATLRLMWRRDDYTVK